MEPSSSSAAGVTISVGTVSIVGTLLGMHYDALLFGLFGGLLFLARSDSAQRPKAIASIISSTLIAGVGSPIFASMLVFWINGLETVGGDTLRRACALALGGGWQAVLPTALEIVKGVAQRLAPKG